MNIPGSQRSASIESIVPEWKILIADGLEVNGLSILRQAAQVDDRSGISADALLKEVGNYQALIVRNRTNVTAAVFEAGRQLRVVGRAGIGIDNIDLYAANAHHVTVVNAPISTSIAVAELTLGLMFSLARSIPSADASLKTGQWNREQLRGSELNGKVLGLIGIGNVGKAVAPRAAALGMIVLGYDPFIPEEELARRDVQPVSLAELYARSDFISLHLPYAPETRAIISGQALNQMKRGVHIICTAKGGLIDETALLGAVESGQVAGAALDVFSQEPPGLAALVSHPRVIATPHIGAQTMEAQIRASEDIAREVLAALRNEPLRWKVV